MNSLVFKAFVKAATAMQSNLDTPPDYYLAKVAFSKAAGYANHLELAGLGTLAAPAVSSMAGHPWKEKNKDRAEAVGLGTLALPYAHNIAESRSPAYAASRMGKGLSRFLSH